jgi:hypothetical protein
LFPLWFTLTEKIKSQNIANDAHLIQNLVFERFINFVVSCFSAEKVLRSGQSMPSNLVENRLLLHSLATTLAKGHLRTKNSIHLPNKASQKLE